MARSSSFWGTATSALILSTIRSTLDIPNISSVTGAACGQRILMPSCRWLRALRTSSREHSAFAMTSMRIRQRRAIPVHWQRSFRVLRSLLGMKVSMLQWRGQMAGITSSGISKFFATSPKPSRLVLGIRGNFPMGGSVLWVRNPSDYLSACTSQMNDGFNNDWYMKQSEPVRDDVPDACDRRRRRM